MLPVTLVAGWLDDGAAVLGQRMAANTPGAAILHAGLVGVGAAGEVIALEEEIAHRSPGCPCCASQWMRFMRGGSARSNVAYGTGDGPLCHRSCPAH